MGNILFSLVRCLEGKEGLVFYIGNLVVLILFLCMCMFVVNFGVIFKVRFLMFGYKFF